MLQICPSKIQNIIILFSLYIIYLNVKYDVLDVFKKNQEVYLKKRLK